MFETDDNTECLCVTIPPSLLPPPLPWRQREGLKLRETEQGVCKIPPHARIECGYPGISSNECTLRACCFDSSAVNGIQCYKNRVKEELVQCGLQPKERIDCGDPDISRERCMSRGCCFDSSIPEVIWCFYPQIKEDKAAAV
ncbi:putative gastrointestinal growth factor xP4 [Rhinatrema bivittatum]|uniref:putative gastrointestinal growth factor xP4 n=1 Tax=Rhinatrema bivittatum TaxID=194408 RepID=UPI00112BB1C6|nr:putative gastrointestinal growth factor xP4 [Rhinatrema bivittatum]